MSACDSDVAMPLQDGGHILSRVNSIREEFWLSCEAEGLVWLLGVGGARLASVNTNLKTQKSDKGRP